MCLFEYAALTSIILCCVEGSEDRDIRESDHTPGGSASEGVNTLTEVFAGTLGYLFLGGSFTGRHTGQNCPFLQSKKL